MIFFYMYVCECEKLPLFMVSAGMNIIEIQIFMVFATNTEVGRLFKSAGFGSSNGLKCVNYKKTTSFRTRVLHLILNNT